MPFADYPYHQKLFLCNNGLSAEAAKYLSELLVGTAHITLTTFHFYNNMSGDNGAKAIAEIISKLELLRDLRFSATRASSEGCLQIAQVEATVSGDFDSLIMYFQSLSERRDLTRLDLSDNSFGAKATGVLASSLRNMVSFVGLAGFYPNCTY